MTSFWKKFNSIQVKLNLISCITSLTNDTPHKLPNNLKFRISENQEVSEKPLNFIVAECSAKYLFLKENFIISSNNLLTIRYQNLPVVSFLFEL